MEIKTAEEILDNNLKTNHYGMFEPTPEDIIAAMKEYAEQFIDYASENVQANYTRILHSTSEKYDERDADTMGVYIPKREFEKIKELIK